MQKIEKKTFFCIETSIFKLFSQKCGILSFFVVLQFLALILLCRWILLTTTMKVKSRSTIYPHTKLPHTMERASRVCIVCVCERGREVERERECVCVWEREREWVRERERKKRESEIDREKERENWKNSTICCSRYVFDISESIVAFEGF